MPLEPLRLPEPAEELPEEVERLLGRWQEAEQEFRGRLTYQPPGGFFPGDYSGAYAALRSILESGLAPGKCFCEWGSGTGVITLLAASLGFAAHGIEVQPEFVEFARSLETADGAVFACGTFVPDGLASTLPRPDHPSFLDNDGEDGHVQLELDPAHVDVVYCYPWPGDEQAVDAVFEAIAREGALLLTDDGEGFQLKRKRS